MMYVWELVVKQNEVLGSKKGVIVNTTERSLYITKELAEQAAAKVRSRANFLSVYTQKRAVLTVVE